MKKFELLGRSLSKAEQLKVKGGSEEDDSGGGNNSCNYRCDNGYTCATTCLTCEYATGAGYKMCVIS